MAPLSYEAWIDYDLEGQPLSRGELEAIRRLVVGSDESGIRVRDDATAVSAEELAGLGLSKREIRELVAKLRPTERPDFELDLSRMRSAEVVAAGMEQAVPGAYE